MELPWWATSSLQQAAAIVMTFEFFSYAAAQLSQPSLFFYLYRKGDYLYPLRLRVRVSKKERNKKGI